MAVFRVTHATLTELNKKFKEAEVPYGYIVYCGMISVVVTQPEICTKSFLISGHRSNHLTRDEHMSYAMSIGLNIYLKEAQVGEILSATWCQR